MLIRQVPLILLLATLPLSANEPLPADADSARAFFDRHNALGDAFDVALADDYADTAVIKSERVYQHGLKRDIEVSAAQWKMLINTGMELSRARGDRSEYSQVRVETDGQRATVRATRYSVLRCYEDPDYYQVLERQVDGSYLIVEMFMRTQAWSDCETSE